MPITFSAGSVQSEFDNYDKDAELTDQESLAIEYIKEEFIKDDINFDEIRFRRRSTSYLSLLAPNDFDFCRIKIGKNAVWFSVHGKHLADDIKNDDRFNESKKNTLHWKVKLKSVEDFKENSDLILLSYKSIVNF